MNSTRQIDNEIETLESSTRNDLAAHLYLTFLLHQINPLFPTEKWASWPNRLAADPTIREDYEDGLLDVVNDFTTTNPNRDVDFGETTAVEKEGDEQEEDEERKLKGKSTFHSNSSNSVIHSKANSNINSVYSVNSDEEIDNKIRFFRSNTSRVRIKKIARQKTHPKTTLVNELHALLQHRITKKLASSGRPYGNHMIDAESPVLRNMALTMANKMGRVMARLKQQRLLSKVAPDDKLLLGTLEYRRYFKQNWQDVAIADLKCSDRAALVNLKRCRDFYARGKRLFVDYRYDYGYDPEKYDDKSEIPEFDVEKHLRAIGEQSDYIKASVSPMELIKEHQKLLEYRENLFIKLCDQVATAQLLSYKSDDSPQENKNCSESLENSGLSEHLKRNGLQESDFLLDSSL